MVDGRFKFWSKILNKGTNLQKYSLWSYLFLKDTTKITASQPISIKNCMNYDHNTIFGLFKFPSGYRKLYLNSPKGYNRKIINAQTVLLTRNQA